MEKLEKKIEDILDGYIPHNGACIEASFLIASEVQDIAIAFAHKIQIRNERGAILTTFPEMESLFTEFIKQYYK